MYSDLFDVLGGANSGGGRQRSEENAPVVSFKAGKMNMELQENGRYMVTPDLRRGSIQLVWADNSLKWEWMDRRDKSVVDSIAIEEGQGGTFERIDTGRPQDRVYMWETTSKMRTMFWMQEKGEEADDVHVAQVNQYLSNPRDANPNPSNNNEPVAAATGGDGTAPLDPEALMQVMQGVNRPSPTTVGTSGGGSQVDALSSILENLGMPQPNSGSEDAAAADSGGDTGAGQQQLGGTLTLADLQGAMQGLATATPPGTPAAGPPLQELVTPGSISTILENEEVCNRLMDFLPENQRTREHLEENLRSPQVGQTLRSLTAALLPDDTGSVEGYHSVLANFQLDPQDGEAALRSGNPIQAFLDCVLASVEREKGEESREETKEEDDNEAMEE